MSLHPLESPVRTFIQQNPDVTHMPDLRRSAILFSQGQVADQVFFIDSGLVKLTRTNAEGGRIILTIRGSGDLVGEEAFALESGIANSEAEVIYSTSIYRLPVESVRTALRSASDGALALLSYLVGYRNALAQKVELLCLHDVEYRVLHYLGQLAKLVSRPGDGAGLHQIPITQLELADLIGATRETTSTVLNQLERRGLVQLSRRMLTVSSVAAVSSALERVREQAPPGLTISPESTPAI